MAWLSLPSAPPPSSTSAGAIWPVSPTPEGLERDTAVRPAAPAPPLQLTNQDGRPFDLASLRGRPVLVSFGYTHCPDVCPTNLADIRDALKLIDGEVGVAFVTIDPARDDAAAMKQYVDYYQAGYVGLTGTDDQIRDAAGAWGVSYARVESGSASGYAMAHTADTFLVDAEGRLRHRIWFGAGPEVIASRVNGLGTEALATPVAVAPTAPPVTAPSATPAPPTPAASIPVASPSPATTVRVRLESTVVRAGPNRIVVTVSDPDNRELATPDTTAVFAFRSTDDPSLSPVEVQGSFIWVVRGGKAAYVAEMTLPRPGGYDATITLDGPAGRVGSAAFTMVAREQSPTPPIGALAPSVRTPIAADVGGTLQLISSDVFPDARFYEHSVDELLAAHRPFVFTIYSPAFCPTTACGPLLQYMKEIASGVPGRDLRPRRALRDARPGRPHPARVRGQRLCLGGVEQGLRDPGGALCLRRGDRRADRGQLRAHRGLGRDPGRDPNRDGRVGRSRGPLTAAHGRKVRCPCIRHSGALDWRLTGP